MDISKLSETQDLVRLSAAEIIVALQGESAGSAKRYEIGNVVCALADVDGLEAAHAFADDAVREAGLRPDDAFGVWLGLYKQGDQAALSKARKAAGLASEELTFVEKMGFMELGGLHSAERLVELVEAGDNESVELARGITKGAYVTERAALFGRLYRAGDKQSLDLAIEAARSAKEYTEQTGDQHYYRSEQALYEMALFAAGRGDTDDTLRIADSLEAASNLATLHVVLFAQGRTESLQYVLQYVSTNESRYHRMSLERSLAKAGYAPALKVVHRRATKRHKAARGQPRYDTTERLEDLATLHEVGDEMAASRIIKVLQRDQNVKYNLHYLHRVGLFSEATKIAEKLHAQDASPENMRILFENSPHNNDLWSNVFEHMLRDRKDVEMASHYVRYLGRVARTGDISS